jgi:hypothetical protein
MPMIGKRWINEHALARTLCTHRHDACAAAEVCVQPWCALECLVGLREGVRQGSLKGGGLQDMSMVNGVSATQLHSLCGTSCARFGMLCCRHNLTPLELVEGWLATSLAHPMPTWTVLVWRPTGHCAASKHLSRSVVSCNCTTGVHSPTAEACLQHFCMHRAYLACCMFSQELGHVGAHTV